MEVSSVPDDDDGGNEGASLLGWLGSIECWYPRNAVGGSKVDKTARESSESEDQVSMLKIVEISIFVNALRGFFNKYCMLGPS